MFSWWEVVDLAGSPRNPSGELRLVDQLLSSDRAVVVALDAVAAAHTLAKAA